MSASKILTQQNTQLLDQKYKIYDTILFRDPLYKFIYILEKHKLTIQQFSLSTIMTMWLIAFSGVT